MYTLYLFLELLIIMSRYLKNYNDRDNKIKNIVRLQVSSCKYSF